MVARKDLSVRIADLMHKFDNESFVLCGRRYKLSAFRDIKVLKLRIGAGNYFDAISAGKPGRLMAGSPQRKTRCMIMTLTSILRRDQKTLIPEAYLRSESLFL